MMIGERLFASGAIVIFCLGLSLHKSSRSNLATISTPQTARPRLIAQVGHADGVKAISFSNDGQKVLTASLDRSVRLWDVSTQKEIRQFLGHTHSVVSAAFSSDGQRLVTGDVDYVSRLWDVATGTEIQRFTGHRHWVSCVAISADGDLVLTGSYDKTARLWSAKTGKTVKEFKDHSDYVKSVAFSLDGKMLLTASLDKSIRVYDGTSLQLLQVIPTSSGVTAAVFSADGRSILAGDESGAITISNRDSARGQQLLGRMSSPIILIKYIDNGNQVAAGSDNGMAMWWNTGDGKLIRRFDAPLQNILSMSFSSDGRLVLAGMQDGAAIIWDSVNRAEKARLQGYALDSQQVAASADGKYVLCGGASTIATLWDLDAGREIQRLTGHTDAISSVALSEKGDLALTGSWDETARLWDTESGIEIQKYQGHSGRVTSVAFSPDYSHVLTGSVDGTARMWDRQTGKVTQEFKGHNSVVEAVAFAPDGRTVLTGSDDMTARLWNVSNGATAQIFRGHFNPINAVAISPDGQWALTGGWDKTIRLWDCRTGTETKRLLGHTDSVQSVAFSSDGSQMLSASNDGTVRTWDLETLTERKRFGPHYGYGISARFIKAGDLILSGSSDGFAHIWDANKGDEYCQFLSLRQGAWVVIGQDDRFDTNDLDKITGLHWLFPDDPFRPLPLEIFMRDYYEPRLMARAINREIFKNIRSLASLNRVQPIVKITRIDPGDSPDVALVTVEATTNEGQFVRGGNLVSMQSRPYDLRLFRGGQLVGQWPENSLEEWTKSKNDSDDPNIEIETWRSATRIQFNPGASRLSRQFSVRVPHRQAGKTVEFSAYAFNEDRVKTLTDSYSFDAPPRSVAPKSRAYLITMGVNAYQNPAWDLKFAANDSRVIRNMLGASLSSQGKYETIPVSLISDYEYTSGHRVITETSATKKNLEVILKALAGKSDASQLKGVVTNAERIRKVSPDDVVLISFSGHGFADRRGDFFLIPYDVAPSATKKVNEALLKTCISSDELMLWIKDIDGAEIVMIVDACHSAAAIEAEDFKPGPMGSRGLGQLAYDKGMRIVVASQADSIALELEAIKQGLLTYALMIDGLDAAQADYKPKDKRIFLEEWLRYPLERVPELYEEVRQGKVKSMKAGGKDPIISVGEAGSVSLSRRQIYNQRPSLFDFNKAKVSNFLLKSW